MFTVYSSPFTVNNIPFLKNTIILLSLMAFAILGFYACEKGNSQNNSATISSIGTLEAIPKLLNRNEKIQYGWEAVQNIYGKQRKASWTTPMPKNRG